MSRSIVAKSMSEQEGEKRKKEKGSSQLLCSTNTAVRTDLA